MNAEYDFVSIGGGTAGLVAAVGARYLGARVALVERQALGGDCLWTGCVPSKALLASARIAHRLRHADRLGLVGAAPTHAFRSVMERMRSARARVAHHDEPERFRQLGIDVLMGAARFDAPQRLEIDGVGMIRSPRMLIATGAVPAVPPIPGLEETGYLTHHTAFDQDTLPSSIVILGGGPIGLEFAQVYARLGSAVTVIEMLPRLLPAEDADVADSIEAALAREGITVVTGTRAAEVRKDGCDKVVITANGQRLPAAEVFVATGRQASFASLALDRAGVDADRGGVRVDDHLATSARGVWAAGDVTGGLQFTHVADYMAKVVVQNALVPVKRRVDYSVVPWVTYTDPEIAHVGLGEAAAGDRGGRVYRYAFEDLDRAIVDAEQEGFVKIMADRRGHLLGATVVGYGAGELLMPLVMAMRHGLSLSKLSGTIFPYPTMVEGVKRAADLYQRERLDSFGGRWLRRVVRWLM